MSIVTISILPSIGSPSHGTQIRKRNFKGIQIGREELKLFADDMIYVCVHAKSLQSCPTLFDPMDCSLPGSSVLGDSPGKNTGVGCHFLLQGIFPGNESMSLISLALAGRLFTTSATWEAQYYV